MDKLIRIIYASAASTDVTEHDIVKFLRQARMVNRKHDVSGMMLYVGGCSVQLLEGDHANVDIVCSTIFRDKRNMRMILREPIVEREFPEWTMGFEAVDPREAAALLGESEPFGSASSALPILPLAAKTLVSLIGRRRWQADRSGMFYAIRRAG